MGTESTETFVQQAGQKVPRAVILSAAKDLHLVVFNEILQMLRSAQHDR